MATGLQCSLCSWEVVFAENRVTRDMLRVLNEHFDGEHPLEKMRRPVDVLTEPPLAKNKGRVELKQPDLSTVPTVTGTGQR